MPCNEPNGRHEYNHNYYAKHREILLKRQDEYRATHRTELREYARKYYAEHREEISSRGRELYAKCPEKREKAREQGRKYHAEHPEKNRRAKLRRNYGLAPEAYGAMLVTQGGRCAICGNPPNDKSLAVDHAHDKSGQVRGLLCAACNTGLGGFRDNPDLLQKAIDYLRVSA
jgi:5-methylcytosine-specific restriction endonuclease McrA